MANLSDFFPAAGGGGGGIPKYEEFTSSGTFTPSQALIDAGGRISYIVVGGGERATYGYHGGAGGTVLWGYETLTSTTGCTVTIGAGGTSYGADGGNTTVSFSSAGGTDVTAKGGAGQAAATQGNYGANSGSNGGMHGAHSGLFGFGQGGAEDDGYGGNRQTVANHGGNYGSGGHEGSNGVDGYVLITWHE